jgi:hypothetical protein
MEAATPQLLLLLLLPLPLSPLLLSKSRVRAATEGIALSVGWLSEPLSSPEGEEGAEGEHGLCCHKGLGD